MRSFRVVAVTGGRDYSFTSFAKKRLDEEHQLQQIGLLVHGGAKGLDTIAKQWAEHRAILAAEFRVPNSVWTAFGLGAGHYRNRVMLVATQPDVLLAFDGGKGTADCVATAKKLGIKVIDCRRSKE